MAFWCSSAGWHCACPWASPAIMSHVPAGGLAIVSKSCQTGRRLRRVSWGWASRCQLAGIALNRMQSSSSSVCRLCLLMLLLLHCIVPREQESKREPEIVSHSLNCDTTQQQQLALFCRASFRIGLLFLPLLLYRSPKQVVNKVQWRRLPRGCRNSN